MEEVECMASVTGVVQKEVNKIGVELRVVWLY